MTIEQLKKKLDIIARGVEKLSRDTMPKAAGTLAQNRFRGNFREGGFVDSTLEPWPVTQRQLHGTGTASKYGPLLSRRNHLMKSVVHETSDYRTIVFSDEEYAAIHNDGGTVHPTVTPKMRRYAWARYFEAMRQKKGSRGKSGKNSRMTAQRNAEAEKWKGLALTRKQRLDIKIPQRKFLGSSEQLSRNIREKAIKELDKIISQL